MDEPPAVLAQWRHGPRDQRLTHTLPSSNEDERRRENGDVLTRSQRAQTSTFPTRANEAAANETVIRRLLTRLRLFWVQLRPQQRDLNKPGRSRPFRAREEGGNVRSFSSRESLAAPLEVATPLRRDFEVRATQLELEPVGERRRVEFN